MSKRNDRDEVFLTHWHDQDGPFTLIQFSGWPGRCLVLRPSDEEFPEYQNINDFLSHSKATMPAEGRTFCGFPKRPLLCYACDERESVGAFALPHAPISLAFCQQCLDAGEPEKIGRETFKNVHGHYPYGNLNVQA